MKNKLLGFFFLIVLLALSGCGSKNPPVNNRELADDAHTVALWHFNESSGQTVADSSGNGRDLVLGFSASVETSDPAWASSDLPDFGNCLAYTASDFDLAYRNSGNSFPDDTLTVEGWVKTSTGDSTFFGIGGSSIEALITAGGNIWFILWDNTTVNWISLTSNGTVTDGQWHYVACTYDHVAMKIYIDGALDKESAQVIDVSDPTVYYIGSRGKYLNGCLDEMRISDIARTAQEISDYYQQATQ